MRKQKTFFLIGSLTILAITMISAKHVLAEEKGSLREMLIASKNVNYVYAIDDYHTYVKPVIATWGSQITEELGKELVSYCSGQIEVNTVETDPLTGRTKEVWIPYDGKSYLFNRTVKDKVTNEYKDYYGIRCKGEFEIKTVYGLWTQPSKIIVTSEFTSVFKPQSFIMTHEKPQPYLFKNGVIASAGDVKTPRDGIMDVARKGGLLGGLGKLLGEIVYDSEDLFQYNTTLCRKSGGTARYVINRGKLQENSKGNAFTTDGKRGYLVSDFVEVEAVKAFDYMFSSSSKKSPVPWVWYFACDGQNRFVVKEYHETKGNNSTSKAYFASNRGLDDLEFTPLGAQRNNIALPVSQGQEASETEEKVAVEVAGKKGNTFKMIGTQEYVGIYNGGDVEGCDLVTVKKNWDSSLKKPRVDTYNYRVCNGMIAKSSETGVESLPQGIDQYIQKLAKAAQRYGSIDGEYQGFVVKAMAIRDKDKCLVEAKVMKGIDLITTRTVNACQ